MKERFVRFLALIAIFTLSLTGTARAAAQSPNAAEVFQAAVDAYNQQHGLDFAITDVREAGGLAYAEAARPVPQSEADLLVLIAEARGGQGWRALAPGGSTAVEYNRVLDTFPEDVLDEATKAFLRQQGDVVGLDAEQLIVNYTGHRLPWPYGKTGYVTQRDGDSHQSQVDFDIQGLAASGDVYASKPGEVVFVKDSSSTTCKTFGCWKQSNMVVVRHDSGEYSWYVHLAYRSTVVSVGQRVGYGTKIGVEGETGYSFGVHLHYMASSGHTTWTDPNNPNDAPWATGITPVDFDEYPWSALVVTYSYTYTSQNGANLPPVCPSVGGVLLFREAGYGCSGLLENFGYSFRGSPGLQNLPGSLNDQASSIRIPSGWSALLYENADRGGGKKCFNAPGDESFANDLFDSGAQLNDRVSSYEVFATPDCPTRAPTDSTPPSGSFSSPAGGAAVGRFVPLAAAAADDSSGVQQVTFLAAWGGQQRVIYTDSTPPYSFDWDVCASAVPDGGITLSMQVIDNAWNRLTGPSINVTKSYYCAARPAGSWSADYWANPGLSGSPALHADLADPLLFQDWGSASPGTGIPADNWGARYTRVFTFPGGDYRFHCQSAGGCRVLIDGQERITAWQEQDFTGQDWSGALSAGSHEVRVEYFDASGEARLEVWWQGPGFLAPEAACSPGQWCVESWGNSGLAGTPALRRSEDETLRRTWGLTGPDALLPFDRFSSRSVRSASFDCGTYTFQADTVDAVRVWVDDALVIDQWSEPAQPASYKFDLALTRGTHTVKVEQADTGGAASLDVGWKKTASCPVTTAVEAVSSHVVRPGAAIEPEVRVRVTGGYLDPARGDGLVFAGGSQLGAVNSQPVRSFVETGQGYSFNALNGLRMTAPSASGSYTSQWLVQVDGGAVSANAAVQVTVDGGMPQVTITSPGGHLTTTTVPVRANITDSGSGVTHAQFLVGYDAGSGWAWRSLGYDQNGGDGWGIDWNTAGIPDQSRVIFVVAAWDRAGNSTEARTPELILDRTPPSASITPLAPVQDSTRFLVQWTASDNSSGLHHFDLQVIDNGSTRAWLNNVPGDARSAWFTGEMGRTYAFQVRAVDMAGNTSAYSSLTAGTLINTCTLDSFEPDGDPAHATQRSVGAETQVHNLCGKGDVDWYSFTAEAGKRYWIKADALGATTDTVLTLYAADGTTQLAENNGGGAAAGGAQLMWFSETGGPLYFTVRHADPSVAGNAVTYSAWAVEAQAFYLPLIGR